MLNTPWRREAQDTLRRSGAAQRSAMDDPAGVLGERGWQATATQPGEEGANFGRWPFPVAPLAGGATDTPRMYLVPAQRGSV
jgi:hypothetical protein